MANNKLYIFEMQMVVLLPGIAEQQERIMEDIANEDSLVELEELLRWYFEQRSGNKLDVIVNIPMEEDDLP
jgi:hypothetical protein